MTASDFGYAFGCIAFYDGHEEWLLKLADDLEKPRGEYESLSNPFCVDEWHTEKHVLWMLLVGMFGNWGTSIRSGWIEDCKGAAAFIRANIKEAEENDERADA